MVADNNAVGHMCLHAASDANGCWKQVTVGTSGTATPLSVSSRCFVSSGLTAPRLWLEPRRHTQAEVGQRSAKVLFSGFVFKAQGARAKSNCETTGPFCGDWRPLIPMEPLWIGFSVQADLVTMLAMPNQPSTPPAPPALPAGLSLVLQPGSLSPSPENPLVHPNP
ncbi:unnamed protein product [Lota lota]